MKIVLIDFVDALVLICFCVCFLEFNFRGCNKVIFLVRRGPKISDVYKPI